MPGSMSSAPVVMIAMRTRLRAATSTMPAAASAARCRDASRMPAGSSSSPARRSLPRSRTYVPLLDAGSVTWSPSTGRDLHGHHDVGALRNDRTGHDPHRSPRSERRGLDRARGDLADHEQRTRKVRGASGEAVHL